MDDINKHFKRESKIMVAVMILPIVLGILFTFLWPYFAPVSKIDICLDNGGSFNYESCSCDFKDTHKIIKNKC